MPPLIQQAADFLPFQFFIYFPIQIILGYVSPQEYLQKFTLGLIWLLFAFFLFRQVWRAGLKRFSAVGA
jgi:ABC-2 type transport system permease protein